MSTSLVASPHSMCELRALAAKTLVTAAAILLFAYPKLQAILFTFGTAYTLYYQYKLVRAPVPPNDADPGGLNTSIDT
jgi:threonine/homoserine/homoserine lactone efflux protein